MLSAPLSSACICRARCSRITITPVCIAHITAAASRARVEPDVNRSGQVCVRKSSAPEDNSSSTAAAAGPPSIAARARYRKSSGLAAKSFEIKPGSVSSPLAAACVV